jgi:hypothetical protein
MMFQQECFVEFRNLDGVKPVMTRSNEVFLLRWGQVMMICRLNVTPVKDGEQGLHMFLLVGMIFLLESAPMVNERLGSSFARCSLPRSYGGGRDRADFRALHWRRHSCEMRHW